MDAKVLVLVATTTIAVFSGEAGASSVGVTACTSYLEAHLNKVTPDRYDKNRFIEKRATVVSQGGQRIRGIFGGNRYEAFVFYVDTIENGRVTDRTDPVSVFCVLDDANHVMGIESEMK
ncbi:hypothetical protein E6C67_01985 [Azospirillum sp. TSA2s]|uniref:hypothetical protein n=1 Tax=Azospirillum sp. TSA2s TaxID=709810 RepID=UPI0010AAA08E|nr:hypothetical protein [Azospirillum sp. TSA2s]QCG92707.1 hypothetical protein E6C67_01985 [Azospirillum sp. TSA2s]